MDPGPSGLGGSLHDDLLRGFQDTVRRRPLGSASDLSLGSPCAHSSLTCIFSTLQLMMILRALYWSAIKPCLG